jgi:inner membrane protein
LREVLLHPLPVRYTLSLMDLVTHVLSGAVLARTGFNRKTACATIAMVIGAELPDIDSAWGFGGPLTGFMHFRGITHTFLGVPFEAVLVTAVVWAIYSLRKHPSTKVPLSVGWLFLGTLVALLSHLLLDWTDNYGLRPFFPFNPHWYAGSFVFIFEPVLFAILLLALLGPWLFGLIDVEVGERERPFRGRPTAIVALLAIAGMYLLRYVERNKAILLTQQSASSDTARFFASPYPGNPFQWHVVADTPTLYQLSTVDTWSGTVSNPEPADSLVKPTETLPLQAAKHTELGRVYLDWSMFPVINELPAPTSVDAAPGHALTLVTFSDARFTYTTFLGGDSGGGRNARPTHSASVTLDMQAPAGQRVMSMEIDGQKQK